MKKLHKSEQDKPDAALKAMLKALTLLTAVVEDLKERVFALETHIVFRDERRP